jgi:phosphoribosylamine-glycine ligase
MRFFLFSECYDGLGLAVRLIAEGAEVFVWCRDTNATAVGRGLGLAEAPRGGETIVADCTGFGEIFDQLRWHGARAVCGSAFADRLEADREFATQIFREAGIKVPQAKSFDAQSSEAALEYASQFDRVVIKPEGDAAGVVPSYVAEGIEDAEDFVRDFAMRHPFGSFVVQEFIEGTALSTEGWFNGQEFVWPTNHTLERKAVANGDLGATGGCAGNIVWPCNIDECDVCRGTIAKLRRVLRAHDYRGPIDINAIVTPKGDIYALEFTPRFGYDATPTLVYGLWDSEELPFGVFLELLALGQAEYMPLLDRFAAGIRLSVAPWPAEYDSAFQRQKIAGLRPDDIGDWFYPYDVAIEDDGSVVTTGTYGAVGVSIAASGDPRTAIKKATSRLFELRTVSKQFRTDLSDVLTSDLKAIEDAVYQQL